MSKALIFYADDYTFEGAPEDAPTEGVQAIAYEDDPNDPRTTGRFVLHSWDFYIYSDPVGTWHATNRISDLLDHLRQGCGPGGVRAVLTGSWINSAKFKEILHRANTEGDFPNKSAKADFQEDGLG